MWDGSKWVNQYFSRLPKFIRVRGEKNKIYYENEGFWVWDQMRDWFWIKSSNLQESLSTVQDTLMNLNNMIFIEIKDFL